ncbi:S-layer homology domain-containing protein [Paenibacillus sp. SAFN-054]|uniref:S-layer homology domain-containing protein n=1 Tax=Paenibacillus sp. SAFN-054 TaxID=3436865 RepID=UPI003F7EDAD5
MNLNLTYSDPNGDPAQMRLSNDGITWSDWEAAAAAKPWTLTNGDGLKTVYYQLRDSSNAESGVYQDTITLDTIPPQITGVTQGGLYNTDVTITSNEGTATLDGKSFVLGSKVSIDGIHTLVVTDSAGNTTTVSFTIDKTAPTVTGVTDGGSYNTNRTITFTEGTATLNGNPYTPGMAVSIEGSYALVVTDAAGNETKVSFTIDKTSPIISGISNGKLYNMDQTVTFDEGTATLNGGPFTSGATISQDGNYTLVVTDKAGNSTTVTFSIDKTPPTVTGVTDGGNYNTDQTITFNEGNALLNGKSYTSGTTISEEGSYTLVITDAAGNVTTVNFSLDITKPVVSGVEDGKLYNADQTVTFNEGMATLNGDPLASGDTISQDGDYTLVVTDKAGNSTTIVFSIDKTPPTVTGVTDGDNYNTDQTITFNEGNALLNGKSYTSGTTISEEGNYTLIVTDAAGNVTTVSFSIDKTKPVVSGVEDGKLYNTDQTVTFNEGMATLNGDPLASGDTISQDGDYTLVVTDRAGNSTTVTFSLDKTPPSVTGVTDGDNYNTDQTITFNEGNALLNGKSYTSGTTINEEGSYTLVVTDAAGNVTTVSFSLDKTKPVVSGVENGKLYNADQTVTFNEGMATLNGDPFASGDTISQDGDYTLVVTDKAGNSTTVTFSLDQTPPSVTGVTDGGSYSTEQTITFTEGTAALNGKPYTSGTPVSEEGSYVLVVTDAAGNEAKVSFKIDKTKPVISGVTDQGEYKTPVTVTFNEGTAKLNGSPFTSGSTISTGGKYTLVVTDEAGNQSSASFTLTLATSNPGGSTGGNGSPGSSAGNNNNTDNGASHPSTPFMIIVNGQVQEQIAQAHVETRNGRNITIVSFDEQKLEDKLQKEPSGSTIVIPIRNTEQGIAELNGRMVKALDNKAVTLQIQINQATYTIPAKEMNIIKISEAFGTGAALDDIKFSIAVMQASDQDIKLLTSGLGAVKRVAPAVYFSITAAYHGKEVEVDQFHAFVERSITIPDGVDSKKITTGVVLKKDGTIAHVPTKIETRDGKPTAIINSLTNSVYSVIYNEKAFADTTHHWAKASIEDMSARMIIEGVNENQFLPDQGITRAEFTAILVRALGMHHFDKPAAFRDVDKSDWFYEPVSIGSSYGLVEGFNHNEFLPDQKMTREEAMVLLARAMNFTHMDTNITESESVRILGAFKDGGQFHAWSKNAAALNAKIGILTGFNGLALPNQQITRAETAVMVQRLLRQAGLI